jgi:Domain of unknown function (DUF4920)
MIRSILIASLAIASMSATAADHGAPMAADIAPVPLAEVLAAPDSFKDREIVVSGRIAQVCQTKGCWIMLTDGDVAARVMTRHKFFLPKDATGNAIAVGKLTEKELNAEQAEHMSKDAGSGVEPLAAGSREWRLLATSIRIGDAAN